MPALILFEDERAADFEPVALTRSVARLRLGLWTHRERWHRMFPARGAPGVICREYLERSERAAGVWTWVNEAPDDDVLFVAAAVGRPSLELEAALRELEAGEALVRGERCLGVRAAGPAALRIAATMREAAGPGPFRSTSPNWPALLEDAGLRAREAPGADLPETLVDLVAANSDAIDDDFAAVAAESGPPDHADHPGVHFVTADRIRLGPGVRVDPGCVLDARDGPIALARSTRVMANAVLLGPLAVAPECLVKPGARLLDGVSLGPVCKVGGEVDASIVQGWSNKQHDGFLGHSYVGCWVNLGAATDTSDLKNDYGHVRVTLCGEVRDTGSRHVGSLIGDHSKTAIHTRLNSGTVLGVSANVFCDGFPDRETPSFTWGGGPDRQEYRLGKAVRVAVEVTARRAVVFGPADEALFARLHQETEARRLAWLRRGTADPALEPVSK
ncbi:MAG: putative sugar nucleotidyl transferase [Candidatus Eiseniibacteriota bacterium]